MLYAGWKTYSFCADVPVLRCFSSNDVSRVTLKILLFHQDDADWFLKADDDTYVILENLRYFLSGEDPDEPVYFGHHFHVIVQPQGYFSGGAGYVLSREALRRFGRRRKGLCQEDGGAEDVVMGNCMQSLGVRAGDSRDSMNRSRFHCFDPQTHMQGRYPDWYLKWDTYGAKSVSEFRPFRRFVYRASEAVSCVSCGAKFDLDPVASKCVKISILIQVVLIRVQRKNELHAMQ